jgi:hypothetical protein
LFILIVEPYVCTNVCLAAYEFTSIISVGKVRRWPQNTCRHRCRKIICCCRIEQHLHAICRSRSRTAHRLCVGATMFSRKDFCPLLLPRLSIFGGYISCQLVTCLQRYHMLTDASVGKFLPWCHGSQYWRCDKGSENLLSGVEVEGSK